MRKITLALACVGICGSYAAQNASAQMMPNWGGAMNQMIMQNMAFDNMMHQNAINTAQNVYNQLQDFRRRTGYTGHIQVANPHRTQQAIAEMNQAFDDYNNSMRHNSNVQDAAVGRWDRQAIRGEQFYGNPETGMMYELPYDHDVYNERGGDVMSGYAPGGNNLYPVYPVW